MPFSHLLLLELVSVSDARGYPSADTYSIQLATGVLAFVLGQFEQFLKYKVGFPSLV